MPRSQIYRRVTVTLDIPTHRRLLAVASREDLSTSGLIRHMVERQLSEQQEDLHPERAPSQRRSKDARISVSLTKQAYAELIALAARDSVSTSSLARRAVNEFIERQSRSVRKPG